MLFKDLSHIKLYHGQTAAIQDDNTHGGQGMRYKTWEGQRKGRGDTNDITHLAMVAADLNSRLGIFS